MNQAYIARMFMERGPIFSYDEIHSKLHLLGNSVMICYRGCGCTGGAVPSIVIPPVMTTEVASPTKKKKNIQISCLELLIPLNN